MCLHYDEKGTKDFREKLNKNHGTIVCYKVYNIYTEYQGKNLPEKKELHSVFRKSKKGGTIGKPRIVTSTRKDKKISKRERFWGRIDVGIHVYATRKNANNNCGISDRHVVPVVCRKKDFVAASSKNHYNGWQAVFTEVEILKKDWDKIFAK